jgi:carbamoyltransferase
MYILGIVEGHNSSAALLKDDEIIAVCFEERLSRLKNDFGYPARAIDYCLKEAGITPEQIDHVALVTANLPLAQVAVKREATFKVADYLKEQEQYWYPTLYEGKQVNYLELFKDKIDYDNFPYDVDLRKLGTDRTAFDQFREARFETIRKRLKKNDSQIHILNHHVAHSMYAIYSTPWCHEKESLVLVADGYGDDCSASVGIFRNGQFEFVAKSKGSGIGRIYRYACLLIGLRPGVDEYKLMGLAPYAKEYHWRKVYDELTHYLKVNGMVIDYTNPDKDIYHSLKRRLADCRFDGIAAGVQKFVEDISEQWVRNCIKETGIRNIVYSGGVSMNIKVNKVLMEMPEVEDIFVGPTGGDESLSIGTAYALRHRLFPNKAIKPLKHTYLGPASTPAEVKKAIDANLPKQGFEVVENPSVDMVAELLAKGHVLARAVGRMEYGARALGNRSILANASDYRQIRKINDQIKKRDFWMPFAPMILRERMHDYVKNPKEILSPFMTVGMDSTDLAKKHLVAALHPADDSMRPQLVEKEHNPELYALLKKFEEKTGIGGLLNTSLNLHGEPITTKPEEAINTFLNSDLDALLMDGWLVRRNR